MQSGLTRLAKACSASEFLEVFAYCSYIFNRNRKKYSDKENKSIMRKIIEEVRGHDSSISVLNIKGTNIIATVELDMW